MTDGYLLNLRAFREVRDDKAQALKPLKQLARAAGINLSSLSHAIREGREVKMNFLLNLAEAMGEDPRDIVKPRAHTSLETK